MRIMKISRCFITKILLSLLCYSQIACTSPNSILMDIPERVLLFDMWGMQVPVFIGYPVLLPQRMELWLQLPTNVGKKSTIYPLISMW